MNEFEAHYAWLNYLAKEQHDHQLEDAAALLKHYHDALVRLGDEEYLVDTSRLVGDEQVAVVCAVDWVQRINYANKALKGVNDEQL
jgi:hypothetical protein